MAQSPSKEWEDGVLVARALSTPPEKGENTAVAVTGRPVDVAPPNSTFAGRAKARQRSTKQVDADDTEDKSVSRAKTSKK